MPSRKSQGNLRTRHDISQYKPQHTMTMQPRPVPHQAAMATHGIPAITCMPGGAPMADARRLAVAA